MTTTIEQKVQQNPILIGEYILLEKIGQGGIAEIYKAKQPSLKRDVAVKILNRRLCDNPDIVRRFERESMVIARLNHPNIVHVIDKGVARGRYYFILEYVDGTSLLSVLESTEISVKTKLDAVVQVCKGLDYAHKNGVVHRDIKPANILVDREGHAKITDFGIAQIVGAEFGASESTKVDAIMGTFSYMSPEQKISSHGVDQTTDIYSVGVIIYEILCGKKPMGKFKAPSELNPEISKDYDQIIAKCLAQERNERYQTAVELKDALLHAMGPVADESKPIPDGGPSSFMSKCRYLDTIKQTKFGATFLVENQEDKNLYVIKKHFQGEDGRKEAKILSTVKHKNVIGIFGSGGNSRTTIVIAEYAQGGSLSDRLVRKYSWENALDIGVQIASGLDIAHKNGLVHGNLRPSNVLFDSNDTVKVTDFGMPPHYSDTPTKENWFAPPGQSISKLSDIFSLGVILNLLITGSKPKFNSDRTFQFDQSSANIPGRLKKILARLLEVNTSERYQNCEEFLADVEEFKSGGNTDETDSEISVEKKESGKMISLTTLHYVIFTAVILLVLFAGILIGHFWK